MLKNLVLALLAVVLCLGPAGAAPPEPYDVNVILSLSGIASFIGQQEATSLRALEPVLNRDGGIHGRPVHFVIADDGSSPQNAVQLAQGIIAKGAPVILGPTLTADCEAVYALAKSNGPVMYCFAPSLHTPAGSYGFSSGISTGDLILAALRYFHGRGWKRVALITSTDASGADGERMTLDDLRLPAMKGVELVSNQHFAISDVSVAAQVAAIKAANPQAIIAWTTGTPTATVLRGLHDAGVDVPVLLNAGNIVRTQLRTYRPFLPSQLLFPGFRFMVANTLARGPVKSEDDAFFAALRAQNVPNPEVAYDLAWDPARVVVEALRHVGPQPTAVQVKDAIENIHSFPGTNSIIDYRDGSQRGVPISACVIIRWAPDRDTFIPISKPGGTP